MSGRKWTVEEHPQKARIIKAICTGKDSLRSIANQYHLTAASVTRYLNDRLSDKVAAARSDQDKAEGQAAIDQLKTVMVRMQKMYNACDEYLTDPENPEMYNLGPRAWELDITYRVPDGERYITKKASLDDLLLQIRNDGKEAVEIRYKHADPRKLIIETASVLNRQLELMAKIEGVIKDTVVNVTINQKYLAFKAIILEATKGYPQVMAKIADLIEKEGD